MASSRKKRNRAQSLDPAQQAERVRALGQEIKSTFERTLVLLREWRSGADTLPELEPLLDFLVEHGVSFTIGRQAVPPEYVSFIGFSFRWFAEQIKIVLAKDKVTRDKEKMAEVARVVGSIRVGKTYPVPPPTPGGEFEQEEAKMQDTRKLLEALKEGSQRKLGKSYWLSGQTRKSGSHRESKHS
jgi:hypothetical protein